MSSGFGDTTQCNPFTITCMTQDLTSLRWIFNNQMQIASYTYISSHTLPMIIPNLYDDNGVTVEVTRAVPQNALSDVFSGTSVLSTTTLALTMLNVQSIQCGTNKIRSQPFNVSLNVQGKYSDLQL